MLPCRLAPHAFVSLENDQQWAGACAANSSALTHLHLKFDCPLFARKFPNDTVTPLLDFLSRCDNPLNILQCSQPQAQAL